MRADDDLPRRLRSAGLDWIVPDWPVGPAVHGLMTTRRGGVSTGPKATFDVGAAAPTDRAALANRDRLRAFLPAEPRWLHQVHGASVVTLDPMPPAAPPTADAAVTRHPNVVCAVRVADCLPVLIADPAGSCVGAAHAGWRGLAAGVLEATVAAMHRLGASGLVAWLGPAIGPAAFEVGSEVRAAFCDRDPAAQAHFRPATSGKWLADLYGLARLRLHAAGVTTIGGGGYCTRHDEARFFSYRRDPDTGRMAALVWRAE